MTITLLGTKMIPVDKSKIKAEKPFIKILVSDSWLDYELLDSGNGYKLERFGIYKLARPEPEAFWLPKLPELKWKEADATFVITAEENGGHWEFRSQMPKRWMMQYKGIQFWAQITNSRHVGVFPEQSGQWDWIGAQIRASKRQLNVLNLFGYTGIVSLIAARAGARITHLDASKKVINWAKENQQLSDLAEKPIRWLVDDAIKFVEREVRRNNQYDGIILDPPKFGRGPKGEVWEFYDLIPKLLQSCRLILSEKPQFIIMTAYSVKASALTLHNALQEIMIDHRGITTPGEVVLKEKSAERLLSKAVYASWSAGSISNIRTRNWRSQ